MIFDNLIRASIYTGLGTRFEKAFDYLRHFSGEIVDGRYELESDSLFALVQSVQTRPSVEAVYESHKSFADIHYIFQGEELIFQSQIDQLHQTSAYDEKDDYYLYNGLDENPLHLRPRQFAVFFPNDGHKPGCHIEEKSLVRKVVMKLRLND